MTLLGMSINTSREPAGICLSKYSKYPLGAVLKKRVNEISVESDYCLGLRTTALLLMSIPFAMAILSSFCLLSGFITYIKEAAEAVPLRRSSVFPACTKPASLRQNLCICKLIP